VAAFCPAGQQYGRVHAHLVGQALQAPLHDPSQPVAPSATPWLRHIGGLHDHGHVLPAQQRVGSEGHRPVRAGGWAAAAAGKAPELCLGTCVELLLGLVFLTVRFVLSSPLTCGRGCRCWGRQQRWRWQGSCDAYSVTCARCAPGGEMEPEGPQEPRD
jgi:hypothetical protein